jgi:multimeric flavodoxin WrbA
MTPLSYYYRVMLDSKHLLIVAHNPSPNTQTLVEATLRGARHEDIEGVEVKYIPPLQAVSADVLWADAIILGTTENFGYMSGALKDFFDRIYYPCLEHTEAMPFAAYIRAGLDGIGTKIAIGKITTGLKWKPVQETIILHGEYRPEYEDECEQLGMLMAASLESGII